MPGFDINEFMHNRRPSRVEHSRPEGKGCLRRLLMPLSALAVLLMIAHHVLHDTREESVAEKLQGEPVHSSVDKRHEVVADELTPAEPALAEQPSRYEASFHDEDNGGVVSSPEDAAPVAPALEPEPEQEDVPQQQVVEQGVKSPVSRTEALPPPGEERYEFLREAYFQKQPPALRALYHESQKLGELINYNSGHEQSPAFFEQLGKSLSRLDTYTLSHSGKDLDGHFWNTAFSTIYGAAIRTAENYEDAERFVRRAWELLARADSGADRPVFRARLSVGVALLHSWADQNTAECAVVFNELGRAARAAGYEKVGDIWRPHAYAAGIMFMKHAGNLPEAQRHGFVRLQQKLVEDYLMDDSVSMRNRAASLRAWVVFLDKYGSLTDASPVIQRWADKYGEEQQEMNYYFARMWVELYGEGDWEKAARTVFLATQTARQSGKMLDKKNYSAIVECMGTYNPIY